MKKLSIKKMATTITQKRKSKHMTQAQLAEATSIHRAMIGRVENEDYIPYIEQLQNLAKSLILK